MVHPAVLEAELQGAHVAGGDQLARLHAEVGNDLLEHVVAGAQRQPAGGTEGEVVGPEGGAGEPKPQAGPGAELAEALAPGSSIRLVRVEPQVVHLIGNGQPGPRRAAGPAPHQQVEVAGAGLVAQQQSLPGGALGQRGGALPGIPAAQLQAQPLGGLQPLAGDGTAVAEHHEAFQPSLPLQLAEAEQGSEGLAGAGPGMQEHILAAGAGPQQAGAQQLDQLALPVAGFDPGALPAAAEWGLGLLQSEGKRIHGPGPDGHCAAAIGSSACSGRCQPRMGDLTDGRGPGAD